MHPNPKNDEAHRLARELAVLTGETRSAAVTRALRAQLERERRLRGRDGISQKLLEIGERAASRGIRDHRAADEILGYDKDMECLAD